MPTEDEAVEPEVVLPKDKFTAPRQDYLPSFLVVATVLDRHARRIPWWVWFAGGALIGRGVLSTVTSGVGRMFQRAFGWTKDASE